MDTVFLLWFMQALEEGGDTELLIGAFRFEEKAREVIEQIKHQPGFRDYPAGFGIHEYRLDEIASWSDGFVRV